MLFIVFFYTEMQDYLPEDLSLVISAVFVIDGPPVDSSRQCVTFTILDDDIFEDNEVFFGILSTIDEDVILNPATVTITILDDDGIVLTM